jgi:hypothetical protein
MLRITFLKHNTKELKMTNTAQTINFTAKQIMVYISDAAQAYFYMIKETPEAVKVLEDKCKDAVLTILSPMFALANGQEVLDAIKEDDLLKSTMYSYILLVNRFGGSVQADEMVKAICNNSGDFDTKIGSRSTLADMVSHCFAISLVKEAIAENPDVTIEEIKDIAKSPD